MLNYEDMISGTAVSGPLFTSPSTVIERMKKVDLDMQSFDVTVQSNASKLQPGFVPAWKAFLDAWMAFEKDNQNPTTMLVSPGTGTVMREIDDYVHRLQAFATGLKAEAPEARVPPSIEQGSTTDPNQPPPTPKKKPPDDKPWWSFDVPWWVISVLTLAGVGGVVYLGFSGYKMIVDVEHKRRGLQRAAESHFGIPAAGDE